MTPKLKTPVEVTVLPKEKKIYKWIIGIDPGVQTGLAIWNKESKYFTKIETGTILKVLDIVVSGGWNGNNVLFRVEDARLRTWFGKADREKLQGAGSIKRDCKIWEDFLTDLGVDFEMVAPKNNKTKLTSESFMRITKYYAQTNQHERDAAMLCYGF